MISPQDETLANELLPCPFCGGRAKIVTTGRGDERNGYGDSHAVKCLACGAMMPRDDEQPTKGPYYAIHNSTERAITAWNTRSSPPTQRGDEQNLSETPAELVDRLSHMLGPDTDFDNYTFSIKRGNLRRLLLALSTQRGDRNAVLEEAARVADGLCTMDPLGEWYRASDVAAAIRALKSDSGDAPEGGQL